MKLKDLKDVRVEGERVYISTNYTREKIYQSKAFSLLFEDIPKNYLDYKVVAIEDNFEEIEIIIEE